MRKTIILITVFLLFILGLYFLPSLQSIIQDFSESPSGITIDEKDKYCQTDDDCAYISVSCCQGRGEPANKANLEKYNKILKTICDNFRKTNRLYCTPKDKPEHLTCKNNKCESVPSLITLSRIY